MAHVILFSVLNILCFDISTFRSMCVVPNMAVVCNSTISYSPAIVFLMKCPYALGSSQLHSRSHICLLKLQHLLTEMFISHYHGLCCPVYRYGWLCPFALVYSIMRLPYLHDSFVLILVHACTSVYLLFLPKFSSIR